MTRTYFLCSVCGKRGIYVRRKYTVRRLPDGFEWYCRYCREVVDASRAVMQ